MNQESKKMWEDILPLKNCTFDAGRRRDILLLKQAEKDGVVYINPPSENVIEEILTSNLSFRENISYEDRNWIVERIIERIKEGK